MSRNEHDVVADKSADHNPQKLFGERKFTKISDLTDEQFKKIMHDEFYARMFSEDPDVKQRLQAIENKNPTFY